MIGQVYCQVDLQRINCDKRHINLDADAGNGSLTHDEKPTQIF
jgi:hypothetical protein